MIYDMTADILEKASKSLLKPIAEVIVASDGVSIPDDFLGFVIQVHHKANTIYSNDGKMPIVSVYEMEVMRKAVGSLDIARQQNSGASIAMTFRDIQSVVDSLLEEGMMMNIINTSQISEDVATTEAEVCLFTNTFEVTCQPLLVEEE